MDQVVFKEFIARFLLPCILFPKNDLSENVVEATFYTVFLGLFPFIITLVLLNQRKAGLSLRSLGMCCPGVQNLPCLQSNGQLKILMSGVTNKPMEVVPVGGAWH